MASASEKRQPTEPGHRLTVQRSTRSVAGGCVSVLPQSLEIGQVSFSARGPLILGALITARIVDIHVAVLAGDFAGVRLFPRDTGDGRYRRTNHDNLHVRGY